MITSDTGPLLADPDGGTNELARQESDHCQASQTRATFLIQDSGQIDRLIRSLESFGLQIDPQPSVDIIDRYFDTPDWQVRQSGWEFRWRDTSGKCEIGLKSIAIDGEPTQRPEDVQQSVESLPRSVRRIPEGQVIDSLREIDTAKLKELFRVEIQRHPFCLRAPGGALIELVLDHVTVTVATKHPKKRAAARLEFDELGLEWKAGSEFSWTQLIAAIQTKFGLLPSRLSTFQRGLQCAGLAPPRHARSATRNLEQVSCLRQLHGRRLTKREPIEKLAYRYLLEQFEQMLCQEPRAWEGLDPEGVHRMRVATRRSRAALRAFQVVFPQQVIRPLGRELKWIAGVLGDVRDLDVYLSNFPDAEAQLPAEDAGNLDAYERHLIEQRDVARRQMIECLSGRRYGQLKESYLQLLRDGACQLACQSAPSQSIRSVAIRSIGKQYKKLLHDGRAIDDQSPDEALHALRIDCKRMRYLLEFFQPTYGKALKPCIEKFAGLQDLLGEFQDACVATKRLRQYAEGVPMQLQNRGELIALGQLISIQQRRGSEHRDDFRNVWKQFDQPGRRKKLLAALE